MEDQDILLQDTLAPDTLPPATLFTSRFISQVLYILDCDQSFQSLTSVFHVNNYCTMLDGIGHHPGQRTVNHAYIRTLSHAHAGSSPQISTRSHPLITIFSAPSS